MKNRKNLIITLMIVAIIMIIGATYAFFTYARTGNQNSQLIAGEIYLNYNEGTNALSLSNILPESDSVARSKSNNVLTFTIDGKNTTTNKDIYYEIVLSDGSNQGTKTRLKDSHLKFDLVETKKQNNVTTTNTVLEGVSYNELNNTKIWVNTVPSNTTSEIVYTYQLRMWISDEVLISDTESSADYTTTVFANSFASVRVSVNGNFEEKVADDYIVPPKIAAEEIIKNVVSYSAANPTTFTGGLVAINTAGTLYNETNPSQTIREYRYSGPSVNNYVYFNCADTAGGYNYGDANYPYNETNCELWRIVGVFKNSSGEWNIKLMRNTVLQASELVSTYTYNGTIYNIQYSTGNYVYWNSKTSGTNNNDWTTAGLQYFLNAKNGTGYLATIKSSSKALIDENYTYYLGNVTLQENNGDTTTTAYNNERDEIVCESNVTNLSNENNCDIWYGNQPSWPGAIALLYPSDVGYAAHSSYWSESNLYFYDVSSVKATSWMMQNANHSVDEWLLSPESYSSYSALLWNSSGFLLNDSVYYSDGRGRPVLNLKSETTSLDGRDGSINLPYVFIGE